jgi:2-keto-4-pentenoate hydratase/2-oxohepta-3-ene-1,7-dioic acid hydratase in catechol pathway
LNYADHAKETNAAIPTEPVIFLKSTSSLCGPFDDIIIPKNSEKTDWEVELAVVIEKKSQLCRRGQCYELRGGLLFTQ